MGVLPEMTLFGLFFTKHWPITVQTCGLCELKGGVPHLLSNTHTHVNTQFREVYIDLDLLKEETTM